MTDKPEPSRILILLLGLVPELPQLIRRGHLFPGVYDTILSVIEEHGSDEQREWSDLAQIVRQDQALLKAEGM
jgi:hypothetical protein